MPQYRQVLGEITPPGLLAQTRTSQSVPITEPIGLNKLAQDALDNGSIDACLAKAVADLKPHKDDPKKGVEHYGAASTTRNGVKTLCSISLDAVDNPNFPGVSISFTYNINEGKENGRLSMVSVNISPARELSLNEKLQIGPQANNDLLLSTAGRLKEIAAKYYEQAEKKYPAPEPKRGEQYKPYQPNPQPH